MRRIIYIIDDINYLGGAHVATAHLLRTFLAQGVSIDVLADENPSKQTIERFKGIRILRWHRPMYDLIWFIRGLYKKIYRACDYPDWTVDPIGKVRRLLKTYDCVCIMSEGCSLRRLVSNLPDTIRKVQMIHTDYVRRLNFSRVAQWLARHDAEIYQGMTQIAVVGDNNAKSFARHFNFLANKVSSFDNLMAVPVFSKTHPIVDGNLKVVTVARFDDEAKASTRNVRIAMKLVQEGFNICWTFIGGGYEDCAQTVAKAGLSDHIRFLGVVENPIKVLGEYDAFALLSHFEGVPMVVYESFLAGTPVLATNVGGVCDQIRDGVNGWLVADEEDAIVSQLKCLSTSQNVVAAMRQTLVGYQYDNDAALVAHRKLLEI